MKLRVVSKKIFNYIRYDLKEIAFPSSLPDPPHIIKEQRRKLTWNEWYQVLKKATRIYAASWVRDIGPDMRALRSNGKEKEQEMEEDKSSGERSGEKVTTEPSVLEDLAVAAKGGMDTLRPALQRVYLTKASTYRDAAKSFIQGYQEGIHQVMEEQKERESKVMEEQTEQESTKSQSEKM